MLMFAETPESRDSLITLWHLLKAAGAFKGAANKDEELLVQKPPVKIELGRLVATPAALLMMQANSQAPFEFIDRHRRGDWGEVDATDKRSNDNAIALGARILSVYRLRDRTRIWVITESDRSSTCVLLPDDY